MSFFVSVEGDEGVAVEPEVEPEAEPEADPVAEPPAGGVVALEEEDGEDDGALEDFLAASSPHATRVSAAAAAISRDLVIPVPLRVWGRPF
jgi:hypothetical protein